MKTIWLDSDLSLLQKYSSLLPSQINLEIRTAFNEKEIEGIQWSQVDLLIMELVVGKSETLDWVPQIRAKNLSLPILIVTAHATKERCIRAINLGVNGLLEKPVTLEPLKEAIESHLGQEGDLDLDEDRKSVFSQNRWVDLTSTEYRILETLKMAQKRLTRAELQSQVWPNSSISENNLDTHLTNLKKKIPELNKKLSVKRGLGYFLNLKRK